MNKMKMIFWLIIIGLFGILLFQNQSYFLAKHSLGINLGVVNYQIPEIHNVVYWFLFFIVGFLMAYFFTLYAKYKNNQTIKSLKSELHSRADTIARLESENESLKSTMSEKHPEAKSKSKEDEEETVEETLPLPDDDKQNTADQ